MKKLLIFLISILFFSCNHEEIKPEITGENLLFFKLCDGGKHQIVRLNTGNASQMKISDAVYMPGIWFGLSKSLSRQVLYVLMGDPEIDRTVISTINMETGQVVEKLPVNPDKTYIGLEYDDQKNMFYALENGEEKHLVSIDPESGNVIRLTIDPIDFEFIPVVQDNIEFNNELGVYIFYASTPSGRSVISIDVMTGEIINSFQPEYEIRGLECQPERRKIYCTFYRTNDLLNSIGEFDYLTGDFTILEENLIYGQIHGIDYNPEKYEMAILFYDSKINIVLYNIPQKRSKSILRIENGGYYYLNYY